MRRIVAGLFISLDGVVGAPEKRHLRYFTDEMGEIIDTAAEHSDAVLLGGRTVMALSYAPARNGARRHTSFRPAVSSKT